MTVQSLVTRLHQLIYRTQAVVAAWTDEGWAPGEMGVFLYLALREEERASLYARRWSWLSDAVPLVHRQDVVSDPPRCWAFTSEGVLLHVTFETWGEVPQHPRGDPRVLVDRTGRLRERWQLWYPPERLDFHRLDLLASQGWLALWATCMWSEPVARGYWLARAIDTVVSFLAVGEGGHFPLVLRDMRLASVPGLAEVLTGALPARARAERLAGILAREGRRIAATHRWQYPEALEEAVLSAWRKIGWELR